MKKLILLASLAALAACSKPEEAAAPPEAAASETMPMDAGTASSEAMADPNAIQPGTYDIVDKDKKSATLTIAADNTYAFTTEEGVVKGTVAAKDGKFCYDAEGDKDPTMCWTNGKPAADGTWTATSDDGQTVTVKRAAA
jgi:hypothetical protein